MSKSVGVYPFTFGFLKIECDGGAVTAIHKLDEAEKDCKSPLTDKAFEQISEYLEGKRRSFDLPLKPHGTEFQKKVWAELQKIPYGETRAYKDIAAAVGNPKACRAVGMVNNKNQLMIVVPCHRVVGSDGSLTGYAGGLDMKAALLELESRK